MNQRRDRDDGVESGGRVDSEERSESREGRSGKVVQRSRLGRVSGGYQGVTGVPVQNL